MCNELKNCTRVLQTRFHYIRKLPSKLKAKKRFEFQRPQRKKCWSLNHRAIFKNSNTVLQRRLGSFNWSISLRSKTISNQLKSSTRACIIKTTWDRTKSAKETKAEQNQYWNSYCHIFNSIFLLNGLLPFSRSYPEIESTEPTTKCRQRKSFGTWCYIVIYATLRVSFSSESKATVFPKYSLKSKARDQSIQARKKLFCHVIVFLFKFLIKIESTWRHDIEEQTPQLTLLYCTVVGL